MTSKWKILTLQETQLKCENHGLCCHRVTLSGHSLQIQLILTLCPGLGQLSTCGTTAVILMEPTNPVAQFDQT